MDYPLRQAWFVHQQHDASLLKLGVRYRLWQVDYQAQGIP